MGNNGGPAFPIELRAAHAQGMTLRDWFAGQALAGLLATDVWGRHVGQQAYQIADAMLAARARQEQQS